MLWALRNIDRLRTAAITLGGVLVVLNLALGPRSPGWRIGSVLALVLFAFVARGLVRWMFQHQIRQHNLQPWIFDLSRAVFYFFFIAAVVGALREIFGIGSDTPFAAAFVGPAVIALATLEVIHQAFQDLPDEEPSESEDQQGG
jgi:hypothetical protein